MACILYSAITISTYHRWGIEKILFNKHLRENSFDSPSYFVKKDAKLDYTEKEKAALAVFSVIIIFSIFEIILTIAIVKSSSFARNQMSQTPQMPQSPPVYYMHYQVIRQCYQMSA